MLDEDFREVLAAVVTTLEHFWLRDQAAEYLLAQYQVPHWDDLIYEYCERPESKNRAHERFAVAHALLKQAQIDSEALRNLLESLRTSGKMN